MIAHCYEEACKLIQTGQYDRILLDWELGSDEFFRLTSEWCDNEATIQNQNGQFVVIKQSPIFV
jgi:hypothetical protein